MNLLNRGQTFTRMVKALAVAGGNVGDALAYANAQNWSNVGEVVDSIQMAAVTPMGTSDMTPPTPAAFDFAEFIRPLTILGKLQGLRRVPRRVRMISAIAGSTSYWAGERMPRPISRATYAGSTLEPLSVIGMVVVSLELLRSSAPSAESVLSRDLSASGVLAMDSAFIDILNAGIAGVKPASIVNGVTPLNSAGSTLANIDADLGLLIQALSDAGSDLQFATFIMRPRTALYLARLRGTGGNLAFPGMTAKGGTLLGLPVVTSTAVPLDIGSPSTTNVTITLLDPSEILVADDGGSKVETSTQTALAMSDSPSAPSTLVSLWQTESACLKLTRYANWIRTRAGMAQVLQGVAY